MTALQPADIDLIDRDAALPGLSCLLDPARLVEALGKAAFPSPPGDIRLNYLRYRAHRDCVGRYLVSIDGSEHLGYAKTFARSSLRKLDKAAARASIPGPKGAGRLVLPEFALMFSWFPNDRKLRSLERLGQTDSRTRLVERVFKGDDGWRDADFELLNYKPEKRLVCRLSRADGRSAAVKFYTAGEFSRTAHLRRNRSFPTSLPVPRYIGGSKKHRVRAFEWLTGRPLRDASLDPDGDTNLYRRAGKLLAELQVSDPAALVGPTGESLAGEARSSAGHLRSILPDVGPAAEECALALGRFVGRSRLDECPVHADFYDKQVIVGPSRLALIDLDQSRLGAAAEDLGCFVAHLELLAICDPGFSARRAARLGQSLLDGYRASGGKCREPELAGWTAFALLRLAAQPFRDRLRDWPGLVQAAVARSRSLLKDTGLQN